MPNCSCMHVCTFYVFKTASSCSLWLCPHGDKTGDKKRDRNCTITCASVGSLSMSFCKHWEWRLSSVAISRVLFNRLGNLLSWFKDDVLKENCLDYGWNVFLSELRRWPYESAFRDKCEFLIAQQFLWVTITGDSLDLYIICNRSKRIQWRNTVLRLT